MRQLRFGTQLRALQDFYENTGSGYEGTKSQDASWEMVHLFVVFWNQWADLPFNKMTSMALKLRFPSPWYLFVDENAVDRHELQQINEWHCSLKTSHTYTKELPRGSLKLRTLFQFSSQQLILFVCCISAKWLQGAPLTNETLQWLMVKRRKAVTRSQSDLQQERLFSTCRKTVEFKCFSSRPVFASRVGFLFPINPKAVLLFSPLSVSLIFLLLPPADSEI